MSKKGGLFAFGFAKKPSTSTSTTPSKSLNSSAKLESTPSKRSPVVSSKPAVRPAPDTAKEVKDDIADDDIFLAAVQEAESKFDKGGRVNGHLTKKMKLEAPAEEKPTVLKQSSPAVETSPAKPKKDEAKKTVVATTPTKAETKKTPSSTSRPTRSASKKTLRQKKRKVLLDSDDDEDEDLNDDEDDEDFVMKDASSGGEEEDDDASAGVVESDSEGEEVSKPAKKTAAASTKRKSSIISKPSTMMTPKKTKPAPSTAPRSATSAIGRSPALTAGNHSPISVSGLATPPRKFGAASASTAPSSPRVGVMDAGDHEHHHLPWLALDKVKDAQRRSPGEPGYDASTLYVPEAYFDGKPSAHAPHLQARKITPAMRNWWEFKSQLLDSVLFYKVGKFYELYHMDADAGVRYLDLVYMKGDTAHCGFPEAAYGKYSEKLVSLGFRVARVEQVETPEMMQQRTGKKTGCVQRAICSVLSPGTRTLTVRDGGDMNGGNLSRVQLLSLFEHPTSDKGDVTFGLCLLDPTTGRFSIGQFDDTANRARLRMLLAREGVAEVAFFQDNLSDASISVLRHMVPNAPGAYGSVLYTEIPSSQAVSCSKRALECASKLTKMQNEYFKDEGFPSGFWVKLFDNKSSQLKPSQEHEAGVAALCACWHVLVRAKIDHELFSMRIFQQYTLPGSQGENSSSEADDMNDDALDVDSDIQQHQHPMVLDGQALSNLEIFESTSSRRREEGTLIAFLDKCKTRFGKRQLRDWVREPLQSRRAILRRQDMVTALVNLFQEDSETLVSLRSSLGSLPDLERLLMRIHTIGLQKPKDHPDVKAVLYDAAKYNQSKIASLLKTLKGMETVQSILTKFGDTVKEKCEENTELYECLRRFILCDESATTTATSPVDMSETLAYFQRSFDAAKAQRLGAIVPRPGVAKGYDAAVANKERIEADMEDALQSAKKELGAPKNQSIKFWHPAVAKNKERFQIEVPDNVLKGDAPRGWKMKTKKKGARRFHTTRVLKLLDEFTLAESALESEEADATRQVFEKFDEKRKVWSRCMHAIADLDCLLSLALVSGNGTDDSPMCVPTIVGPDPEGHPVLELQESRHPCVAELLEQAGGTFVPNDVSVGGAQTCLLLTGPNMGGKSTLLRQTCVAVIMAQIGCYVPAAACTLTPVDRIFTRLGASDRIMAGQSTFFVELDETATVLHHATPTSLVILDELGRGTSTFDGTAIAHAVVERLCADDLRCRIMFATHYHSLVQECEELSYVKTGHMSYFAENDTDVTFLYKLVGGIADSHGMNVARLAKLPEEIINEGQQQSAAFQRNFAAQQILADLQDVLDNEGASNGKEALETIWARAQKLLKE